MTTLRKWKGCTVHPGLDAPGCHGCWMANHSTAKEEIPAGDGGCSDESPNYARAQRVNRSIPGWRKLL